MEFSVYSQNGEDGILDFLIEVLDLSSYPKAFIEFGVQNYKESNTRFLLKNRNYQGLIIDASKENIDFVKRDEIYWKYDLEAKCAFITAENIDMIIKDYLSSRNLSNVAILSIDIDGVDYFIWESIKCITPCIVIIEYNALFGSDREISVPYRADFNRFKEHFSGLYFGASIKAIIQLGKSKNYEFIGADSSGTNLFFIHQSLKIKGIKTYPLKEYCTRHNARQSRDEYGNLNFKSGDERTKALEGLLVYNTSLNKSEIL
ncbi:hypothetical protein [Helicobacter sp. MIT 14-3879]|uniref:hypothetical protein n=1 Tax=Helicobacter sp. MIT 14-3879 TaxID=2040649 RepID=UPI0021626E17|nr:hypothetical protein [Helicobacter sp. MIT 14-3879]